MKNIQTGTYTPQFIHVLMGSAEDTPPRLISLPQQQQSSPLESSKNYYTNQQLLQPLKVQRPFSDLSAHVNRNQLQLERQRIKSLEAELARCTHIQKQCQQYETIVENLKTRNKQLEKRLLEFEDRFKQLSAEKVSLMREKEVSRVRVMEPKQETPVGRVLFQEEEAMRKRLLAELCGNVEQFVKDRIAEFIQTIKNERMTQRLEGIIESFLEELLQINPFLVQSHTSKSAAKNRSVIGQSPPVHLTLGNSRMEDSKMFEKDQKESKFVVLQSSMKKPVAAQQSIVIRVQDMSIRDTSMYDRKDDRDRSKSQRRKRIFQ